MSESADNDSLGSENEDYELDQSSEQSGGELKTGKRKKPMGKRKSKKLKKKVKRENNPLARFYEDQASEDSQEEESEDDDDISDTEKNKAKDLEKKLLPLPKRNRLDILNLEGEELENYIMEKDAQFAEEVEIEGGELVNAGLLPTAKDPPLFAVRCKPGMERDAVLEIMTRYFDSLGTSQEFHICSVTSVDKTKGFVYIEAFTDGNVFRAITNLSYLDSTYVKLINHNDRIQILEPDNTKKYDLKSFQYVRMRRGIYDGDLAQIVDVYDHKSNVVVRMIPRLSADDENDEDGDKLDDEEEKNLDRTSNSAAARRLKKFQEQAKKKIKPPQRLFVPGEYTGYQLKRDISGRRNYYLYKGQKFVDGLLYKTVNFKSIQAENVNPTIEEIQMFAQALGEKDDKIYDALADLQNKNHRFHKGDKVRVIKGDLKNLEGIVTKVTESEVTVIPSEDLKEPIDFNPSDLVKSYKIGDCVKVVAGKNAGKIGFIIRIEENIAKIKVDDMRNDIGCFLNDLILAEEGRRNMISDGVKNQMQDYKKFDFLMLNDQKTFGIILSVDESAARILDNFGNIQTVNAFQILHKINTKKNHTRNDFKQTFTVGASVKVLEGLNKGKVGTIKHILHDVLFLFNIDFISTAGIFVEKANNCYLLSSLAQNNRPSFPNQIQNQQNGANKNLIGQKCGVISGPWKGYQGIVKEANDRNCRLELISKCKIIDIGRDKVKLLSEINDNAMNEIQQYNDPKTPMHRGFNPQSPYPLQSPGYDAASPGWAADMASPGYDSHLK